MDAPGQMAPAVKTKDEFVAFLAALADDVRGNPRAWENKDLPSFLDALASYAEDIQGYYKNSGQQVDASTPSWRLFAEMLCGARVYE